MTPDPDDDPKVNMDGDKDMRGRVEGRAGGMVSDDITLQRKSKFKKRERSREKRGWLLALIMGQKEREITTVEDGQQVDNRQRKLRVTLTFTVTLAVALALGSWLLFRPNDDRVPVDQMFKDFGQVMTKTEELTIAWLPLAFVKVKVRVGSNPELLKSKELKSDLLHEYNTNVQRQLDAYVGGDFPSQFQVKYATWVHSSGSMLVEECIDDLLGEMYRRQGTGESSDDLLSKAGDRIRTRLSRAEAEFKTWVTTGALGSPKAPEKGSPGTPEPASSIKSWMRTDDSGQPYQQSFDYDGPDCHNKPAKVIYQTETISSTAANVRIYDVEYLCLTPELAGWCFAPDDDRPRGEWAASFKISSDGHSFTWGRKFASHPTKIRHIAKYEVLR